MNINEILGIDTKAYNSNYDDYQNWKSITPFEAKRAIKEIVEQTIKKCAENAEVKKEKDDLLRVSFTQIDKESILNTINEIIF
jgi:hypothetical protein